MNNKSTSHRGQYSFYRITHLCGEEGGSFEKKTSKKECELREIIGKDGCPGYESDITGKKTKCHKCRLYKDNQPKWDPSRAVRMEV